jgi:hypothetical protein
MTCEELIHALGRETPRMMRELLDVATQYAIGEEAVQANFRGKAKAIGHLSGGDGADDPTSSQRRRDRRNEDRKCHGEEMVAMTDYATRPQPHGRAASPEHFEKALNSPTRSMGTGETSSQGPRHHEGLCL